MINCVAYGLKNILSRGRGKCISLVAVPSLCTNQEKKDSVARWLRNIRTEWGAKKFTSSSGKSNQQNDGGMAFSKALLGPGKLFISEECEHPPLLNCNFQSSVLSAYNFLPLLEIFHNKQTTNNELISRRDGLGRAIVMCDMT